MNSMVNLSAGEAGVKVLGDYILAILQADADESTKVAALNALVQGSRVSGNNISYCSFVNNPPAQVDSAVKVDTQPEKESRDEDTADETFETLQKFKTFDEEVDY